MSSTRTVGLILVALVSSHSSAFAQIGATAPGSRPVSAIQEPREGRVGQFRAGSVLFTPSLQLTQVGLETNVFNDDRSREKADLTATLLPQGEIFFGTERFRLRTTVGAGFVYYAKYKSEQTINPRARVEVQQKLGKRILLFADNSFALRKDRPNEEIEIRARRRALGSSAGIQLSPTHRITLRVAGAYSRDSYEHAEFRGVALPQTLDYASVSGAGAAEYHVTPYTALTAGAVVTQIRFDNSPDRDGLMRSTYAGFNFGERALVSGMLRVGYTDFAPKAQTTVGFRGAVADAALGVRVTEWTHLDLGARRELKFSYALDAPHYLSDMAEAGLQQRLLRYLDVAGGTREYRIKYPTTFDGASRPGEKLRTYTGSVGVHVKGARIGVYGSYWTRPQSGRREGTTWGVTVTSGRFNVNSQGIFMGGFER